MDTTGIENLPRHVGVIMDGNGRWAKQQGLGRSAGHRAGTERLRGIIRTSSDLGVEVLSIFAFSTENWKRPQGEVDVLMGLLREFFSEELDALDENRVRIRILGALEDVSQGVRRILREAMERTAANTGLQLNIAFNYGSRSEAVRAARLLAAEVQAGRMTVDGIDEAALMQRLYTHDQPDVDFVIRTSGEMRLSNFLLLQCAYAEFYFTDTLWPDFSDEEYKQALLAYAARDRRYGGVK
ncbi:MAG: isoprenyl transferase [Clostridia bacterium]|nr:isoprenyl transferase [Clostridia bacterium]